MNIINQIKNLEKAKEQEEKVYQKEVENHLKIQEELEKKSQLLADIQRRTSSLSQEVVKREEIHKDRSKTIEKYKSNLKATKNNMRTKEENYEKRKQFYKNLQIESSKILKQCNFELATVQTNSSSKDGFSNSEMKGDPTELNHRLEALNREVGALENELQELRAQKSEVKKISKEEEELIKEMQSYDIKTQEEIEMYSQIFDEESQRIRDLEVELNELGDEMVIVQTKAVQLNDELSAVFCVTCGKPVNVSTD